MAVAEARMAALNTSRGCTTVLVAEPKDTMVRPMGLFFRSSEITQKVSTTGLRS